MLGMGGKEIFQVLYFCILFDSSSSLSELLSVGPLNEDGYWLVLHIWKSPRRICFTRPDVLFLYSFTVMSVLLAEIKCFVWYGVIWYGKNVNWNL